MILRCKVTGSGVEGDPFTPNLPTFRELPVDVGAGAVLVLVGDEELPANLPLQPGATISTVAGLQVLTGLTPALHALWHAHLDHRYAEHAGAFRPHVQ